jgi:hypothetical protein
MGGRMKRFTNDGRSERERQELIPAHRNAEEESPLGLSLEGGLAGPRRYSRRQAIGLLGGSLAGVILLSTGLAAPAKAALGIGIRGPGGYTIPQLRAVRTGNWYTVTLEWKCVFDPSVVNRTFNTQWVLKEADSAYLPNVRPGANDDFISATVEPNLHSAFSPKKVFVPSRANPSNPQEVSFKDSNVWHVDDLDTELGDEEIYASVTLDENTVGGLHTRMGSNEQSISP